MKKIIIGLFLITILVNISKNKDDFLIPDEALRFRIIANSNSLEDQLLKNKIKTNLEKDLFDLLSDTNNYQEAKQVLENNLSYINKNIFTYTNDFTINIGKNYFPKKVYKGVTYAPGEYDSLVITLGKGLGNNWWCVLYPPLCLIDEQTKEMKDYEYQLYISKLFKI